MILFHSYIQIDLYCSGAIFIVKRVFKRRRRFRQFIKTVSKLYAEVWYIKRVEKPKVLPLERRAATHGQSKKYS